MTSDLPIMMKLAEPELASHLRDRDGVIVARTRRTQVQVPWRSAEPPELPHATLVHDLERDRRDMRARFLARLRQRVAGGAGFAELERAFGFPLLAAFHVLYGGRGRTRDTPGFHRWAHAIATGDDPLVVRQVMLYALVDADLPGLDELFADAPGVAAEQFRRRYRPEPEPARDTEPSDLEAAIENGDSDGARRAFRALVVADRAKAATFADAIADTWCDDDPLVIDARVVARFPELAALHAELDRWFPRGDRERPIIDLYGELRARGATLSIDAETGHAPASHDDVLYWLADLVPALAEADFDQVAREDEPYTLRAYHGGSRWTCRADNHGDFYDVASCLGLVNAVLEALGDPHRVVALQPPDQAVRIVAAHLDALASLRHVMPFGAP